MPDRSTPTILERPNCPACGGRMRPTRLEPDDLGYERRTFECSTCRTTETEIVELRTGRIVYRRSGTVGDEQPPR
jgi:Transposase zinc-ribbon domain